MKLERENILLFTRTMRFGGTENVVLQLCKILKPEVNKIIVCSCGGINVQKLQDMGITHYIIPDVENKSIYTLLTVLKEVDSIIRKNNITVVHTHHRMAAFYTYILSKLHRFIFINTSHNTFYNKKNLTRFIYQHAHLITCGEMVKKNLINYFRLSDTQITVIHNAVEPFDEDIKNLDELDSLKKKGYTLVGNVGRLTEQKGMTYFIKSFPIVKKIYPMIKYIIIGDGEQKENLLKQVYELGINEDVIFLGYREDIRNVISQLDFIVLSSLWEGLPLTPIEAFSVEKTVVATAIDGTIEIIKDGENGFLVSPKDPNQIAEKVVELIKQPKLKHSFEEKGKKTYLNEFSFNSYREQIISYYSNI